MNSLSSFLLFKTEWPISMFGSDLEIGYFVLHEPGTLAHEIEVANSFPPVTGSLRQ